MQTACYWFDELPLSLFTFLFLPKVLLSDQLFYDMLEDCSSEGWINICKGDADHFICLLVLWDLVDETVCELLRKCSDLFLI